MAMMFMIAIEGTIVATAMPTIVGDLGDFDLFSWVFTAYLLTQAVTIPIYGRLADLYGRRRVLFIGMGVFLTASLLCGLAWGMVPLIALPRASGRGRGRADAGRHDHRRRPLFAGRARAHPGLCVERVGRSARSSRR